MQLAKAQLEILDAWEWYEEKQAGLGDRFKQALAEKIKLIQENPLHYPVKGKYREAKTDTFTFLIVFKFNKRDKIIYIISVFHTSRHPKKKH